MNSSHKLTAFIKKEPVFCAAALCALISALFVRPDAAYINYPDYRTLCLIFCLMTVVAGFQSIGVFSMLGYVLLKRAGSLKSLALLLVFLCFFSSMLITNDVALITFIPFTVLIYRLIRQEDRVLKVIVLETIAANLGSMATPVGNPQNIYLYSLSGMSMLRFARSVLPYVLLSGILLAAVLLLEKRDRTTLSIQTDKSTIEIVPGFRRKLTAYILLFLLCFLVVFRVLPYLPVTLVLIAVMLFLDRKVLRSVDYFLLLTFLFFFIFVGNVKRVELIQEALSSLLQGRELLFGILASQVISNVPAAILLSGFTENHASLLTAVNLGGLGTLVASLASLISYQYYSKEYPGHSGSFLGAFTRWNLLFLAVLVLAALLLGA